jgi:hypothetical protein
MPDPTAGPCLSIEPSRSAWLLTPADLAAIHADRLRDRLAAGEQLDEDSPACARLAAWLREVANGGTR